MIINSPCSTWSCNDDTGACLAALMILLLPTVKQGFGFVCKSRNRTRSVGVDLSLSAGSVSVPN